MHEKAPRKMIKMIGAFTLERHESPQEWPLGWNTCHPSDWHFDSHLHPKNPHSLALRCSEGTERCIALIGGRWSSLHSSQAPCTLWLLLDTPACPTVIRSTWSHWTVRASPSSGIETKKWRKKNKTDRRKSNMDARRVHIPCCWIWDNWDYAQDYKTTHSIKMMLKITNLIYK